MLLGLVSFGAGCGMAGEPGVYTNVRHYHHWIADQIKVSEEGKGLGHGHMARWFGGGAVQHSGVTHEVLCR